MWFLVVVDLLPFRMCSVQKIPVYRRIVTLGFLSCSLKHNSGKVPGSASHVMERASIHS